MELHSKIHARIASLCAEGDELTDAGSHHDALVRYSTAWGLLPEPKMEWEAATWILAAMGDVHFVLKDFGACRDSMSKAVVCPGGLGNPFLHLRLGESCFELGDLERSADELMRAYMGGGAEIFREEDERYFAFLKTRAKAPPSGW